MMESQLRREIEVVSNSEGKFRQRCNELESLLGSEASEKDEYSLKLRTQESRIQALEKQLTQTEDEKTDLEIRLSSLTNMLKKNFGLSFNGKLKKIIPTSSSSPTKGFLDDDTESGFSVNGKRCYQMLSDKRRSQKLIPLMNAAALIQENKLRVVHVASIFDYILHYKGFVFSMETCDLLGTNSI